MRVDQLAQRRFTRLYELHYWSVLRFLLRRLGDEPRARDLTAEVFVVAWRRLDELPDPVLPWLYGAARKILANELKPEFIKYIEGGKFIPKYVEVVLSTPDEILQKAAAG